MIDLDYAQQLTPEMIERRDEEKRRGEEAKQLLRHPLLKEALGEIEGRLIEQLAVVDIAPERVARLQAILAAKRIFQRYLTTMIESGQLAIEEERRESLMARAMQGVRAAIGR